MKTDLPDLAKIVANSGVDLYRSTTYQSGTPKQKAQRQLKERTHYVDDGTLKGFKARITQAWMSSSGLAFWIMESMPKRHGADERGFRAMAFDVYGNQLGPDTPAREMHATSKAAERAFWAWFNDFDLQAHYKAEITRRADRMVEAATDLRKAARKIKI